MTQRERTLKCLKFEPADRLCTHGNFREGVWRKLETHFETKDRDKISCELGLGFMKFVRRNPSTGWIDRSNRLQNGRGIVHPDGSIENEWGVRRFRQGDYQRYIFCPLADFKNVKHYTFPPLDALEVWDGFEEKVRKLKKNDMVSARIPNFYRWGWEIRGMENFLCDIALESTELITLLDLLEEYHVELARVYGQSGVDILALYGDLAEQRTTLMAPDAWRKHFKPRMARVIETAKNSGVDYVYLHSDGNLMPIIDDLVEVRVDILNPVQPECMDPTELRKRHLSLVMHGTISSQKTLPFGTKDDVKNEVSEIVEKCGRKNGLTLAPNNTVLNDVPLENLLCVYDTVKEIGPSFYKN